MEVYAFLSLQKKIEDTFTCIISSNTNSIFQPGVKTRLVVPEGEEVIHSEDSTTSNINNN